MSVILRMILAFFAVWLLINVVAVLLVSGRRFAGWDIWLAGASVIVGLAIAVAIVMTPL
jgi:hypothetical protein